MYVAVHEQHWVKATDDPVEGDEPDVGRIFCLGNTERWRVRDEHVELAAGPGQFEPDAKLQAEGTPPHLCLGVLVRARLVTKAPAQPGYAQPLHLDDATVNVVATLRSGDRSLRLQRQPGQVRRNEALIVISGHVQKRHVGAADQVLEIVERQVAARDDEVGPELADLLDI